MPVELVVFDLAGTTVHDNNDVPRILQKSLERFDVEISIKEAARVMGIPKPIAIKTLLDERGFVQSDEEMIDKIHQAFIAEMILFYKTNDSVREKEGVSHTFQKLKSVGIKVAVDTGFDRQITTPLLERMGWLKNDLIDFSVTSDEVPRGRPFPDMIFKSMALTGVSEVSRVAKVGDTASDMQEGIAAGCQWVIGVTTGAYTREELTKEKHTHLIDTIPEVLSILAVK
jgi:phosphonatase-like hydrolase